MSQVIGIDLGTTNTVVGSVRDGQASALADEDGEVLIPSVVSFHPNGSVLVGTEAKQRRVVDASNTIYSVKRLIGRSWDSEEVRRARTRFPFEMREGPGQAALVVARRETYTLPEISAFVLRKAKSVAEAALRTTVERAVITVPANFNDLQRAATKVAGRVAGLEVLRILNEPTAAALAYGFGKTSSERLAVYDFGGGTFDVTLLDLSDNVFEVLATAGNTFLGGDDIDIALAERMADEFLARNRIDPRSDPQMFERLRAAAEQLKQRLSSDLDASIQIEEVAHGTGGKVLGMNYAMTRAQLERLAAPIVDRTFDVCREALSIARRQVSEFDEILLVGGSTRMPLVQRRVAEFFQREVRFDLSPDEVVAVGAGIQANALTLAERRHGTVPPAPAVARQAATEPAPSTPRMVAGSPLPARTLLGLPPPVDPAPQSFPATKQDRPAAENNNEESVAFSLADDDIQELEIAPPALRPAPPAPPALPSANTAGWARPGFGHYGEDDITKKGEVVAVSEDEPTHVGRSAFALAALQAERVRLARRETPASLAEPALDARLPVPVPIARSSPPVMYVPPASPSVPLLVDVTPLTLSVETIRGFCDTVITRNTPVPCEQTRDFATAADGQTLVRVRVAQGESRRFGENTLLGEVELSGLLPAPRGVLQISVTFALDTNGMLSVSAVEKSTGRATTAQLRLLGLPDNQQIAAMAARQLAGHA